MKRSPSLEDIRIGIFLYKTIQIKNKNSHVEQLTS